MIYRIAFLLAVLFALMWASFAQAKPTHIAQEGQITVILHDDKCALSAVSLPLRATWKEGDKHFEGCVGQHPSGVLIFYFADKSIVLMLPGLFQKVTGV
jgi:hypothetical protein